ncbi:MAG: hopanoid biosynthesis associated radical SAM protein HpnJ [Candidatus Methylacidiphilales bacterium]|nr:hopanoid biosynthesis associated radical SAM protein HpnJ [Candidatus Methylacidiphilales bacterium]
MTATASAPSYKKTLFLNPPSWQGFDGGAGSRYQAKREVRSFWYPTWLAQPAALIPGSKLVDAPPHDLTREDVVNIARDYELVIIHTSSPTLRGDAELTEALKNAKPDLQVGFVGAQAAVLPDITLNASRAIDFVCRREFDFTCQDLAKGLPIREINGVSWRNADGEIVHNPERALIHSFDEMPSVMDVYKRDLVIENYAIGYLRHPYLSHYTGRGCPAQCTFCLWPQTVGGHQYRAKSPMVVAAEMAYARKLFPQVKEFFFDDDTFTAHGPRVRQIAPELGKLGIMWSCNARANVPYETLKVMRDNGLRLLLVGYESGSQHILDNIKKGVRLEQAREFTRNCKKLGITIHGTFILGLPGETRETLRQTIRFAQEMDPYSMQVSLAAPYPGTELYRQAQENGWFGDDINLLDERGQQTAVLQYKDLSKQEIFDALEQFYRAYYFRFRPISRIVWSMLQDRQEMKRRLREASEFFTFLKSRRAAAA